MIVWLRPRKFGFEQYYICPLADIWTKIYVFLRRKWPATFYTTEKSSVPPPVQLWYKAVSIASLVCPSLSAGWRGRALMWLHEPSAKPSRMVFHASSSSSTSMLILASSGMFGVSCSNEASPNGSILGIISSPCSFLFLLGVFPRILLTQHPLKHPTQTCSGHISYTLGIVFSSAGVTAKNGWILYWY